MTLPVNFKHLGEKIEDIKFLENTDFPSLLSAYPNYIFKNVF